MELLQNYINRDKPVEMEKDSLYIECKEPPFSIMSTLRRFISPTREGCRIYIKYNNRLKEIGRGNIKQVHDFIAMSRQFADMKMWYVTDTYEKITMEKYFEDTLELDFESALDTALLEL